MNVRVCGARANGRDDLGELTGRNLPVTLPDAGQNGVRPATDAGAGVVAVWHSQMTTLPFTAFCAKWMWAC